MKKCIFLLFATLLALHIQAQDSTLKVLESLNHQVDYLNEMDKLMYPEYMKLIDLNNEMLRFTEGKQVPNLTFKSDFNPPDTYYKKAVYQKLYLPVESRDDLLKRLDSLRATIKTIATKSKELEAYLAAKAYEKDNMLKGYELIEKLSSLSRTYLVRHEDLHSVLLNVWYDFYVKKRGRNLNYLIVMMNRALSQLHVVYLDLGYDPGFTDCNKHLREVNDLLATLKARSQGDSLATNSKDFQKFITPFDTLIFQNYGAKGTIPFFKKYNGEFVKRINTEIIPTFNNFIKDKNLLCIKGKTEPPFFDAIVLPVVAPTIAPQITPPPSLTTTTPKILTPIPKPEKKDSVKKEIVATPPKPEAPKVSVLEGYATNNLIFLLDVSGSMRNSGRLDTMKNAMKYIVNEMRPDDRIGLITYSGNAQILLAPTPASRKDKIIPIFDRLKGDGKSNLRMGLDYAYTQMMANKLKGGNNRVIVVTDGYIPITDDLKLLVGSYVDDEISLSVFLFGSLNDPNANADKLSALAQTGKGNFTAVSRSNARPSLLKEAQAIKKKVTD